MGFDISPKAKSIANEKISKCRGRSRIARICGQRQCEEHGTQDIFSLSYPRDRLNVQRVNGKERGHEGALPKRTGHLLEHQKGQQHRDCMKYDVGEVMAARVQSIQLAIKHVRKRGERVPVPRMSMRECGDYPFSGKSSYDDRIFIDVNVIIKIDEIMSQRLTEYGPGACYQTKADEEVGDP
jgi:hypothetical protein